MDWEPAPSAVISNGGWTSWPPGTWDADEPDLDASRPNDWDSFAVNKQRMFPRPQAEETGLESLLAGWGLDGGANSDGTSSMISPSMAGQKQGLVLDESLLGSMRWCLVAARCVGAMIGAAIQQYRGIAPAFSTGRQTLLGLEMASSAIGLALLSTTGDRTQPHSIMKLAFELVNLATRCIVLVLPAGAETILPARLFYHGSSLEWTAWGMLDLISCFL